MSWNPALDPVCPEGDEVDRIAFEIVPRARDLGDFEVRRALPSVQRQMVGPFIFFDQAGPAEFLTGQGVDVRPHPHIGLGTVTYLYRGEFFHRDSTGAAQVVEPGAVNWMIAGKGVTHSERTRPATRKGPHELFGVQTWMALPEDQEDRAPSFAHHGKQSLPVIEAEGKQVRLILGTLYGQQAPAEMLSETFYADALIQPGAVLPLPNEHEDRGIYILEGEVEISGRRFAPGRMLVFRPGDPIDVKSVGRLPARIMMLGGATMEGPRHIWWNFVSSSKEKIEEAKEAWRRGDFRDGLFSLPPGDDFEYIDAPER
ncbi:pirin family protein [Neomegalonema sp.]|uniref:pirin family protein n=1 Tax=Neomegalonema sp. TaxID=2039713 RepID=UPI0026385B34|nr:pirin family protein [Neomegalonema sp.]MDD2868158.1 pirin family protein [Neomegalonema sp.]